MVNGHQNHQLIQGWSQTHTESQSKQLKSHAVPTFGSVCVYGPHVPVYTPDNVWAPDEMADGVLGGGISSQTCIRASMSSWTVCCVPWRRRMPSCSVVCFSLLVPFATYTNRGNSKVPITLANHIPLNQNLRQIL